MRQGASESPEKALAPDHALTEAGVDGRSLAVGEQPAEATDQPLPAQPYDIVVEGLIKKYGSLTAVQGISFSVRKGEIFGILGPNGAGKTTTLECIEGLLKPSSGQMTVLGVDVRRHPGEIKQHIGVQLQASAFFDYLSLKEILDLFVSFYRHRVSTDDLLRKVGLWDKRSSEVKHLSGGQKQRFTMAATLLNDPEVIFLDEPTTGLDPAARRNMWELIQAINADRRTVVLTTHYMEEAEYLCHRVAIMDQGRIVALDTPASLVHALPAPFEVQISVDGESGPLPLETLDCAVSVIEGREGDYILKTSDAARTLPSLLNCVYAAGAVLTRLEVKPATLEDVFLELTGRKLRE